METPETFLERCIEIIKSLVSIAEAACETGCVIEIAGIHAIVGDHPVHERYRLFPPTQGEQGIHRTRFIIWNSIQFHDSSLREGYKLER